MKKIYIIKASLNRCAHKSDKNKKNLKFYNLIYMFFYYKAYERSNLIIIIIKTKSIEEIFFTKVSFSLSLFQDRYNLFMIGKKVAIWLNKYLCFDLIINVYKM